MKKKVFIIGAHKTGTTSLEKCLEILGYKIFPPNLSYKKNGLIDHLEKGDINKIFKTAEDYDGFDDSPWNHGDFYKKLDTTFEGSKFILTIRNSKNWLDSLKRWDNKMNLRKTFWYNSLSKTCFGMESYMDDLDKLVKIYEKRNEEIVEYFKDRDDLLIMDLEKGDGWDKLCTFLECKIPNKPFPHLNKTK